MFGFVKQLFVLVRDSRSDEIGGFALRTVPPHDLLTDGGDGPNRRYRVDVGQTSFFAGREFRTFRDINLTDSTLVIKGVVPIDLILFGLEVQLISGQLRVETVVGGTEGGSFSEPIPVYARNTMSERPTPFYEPQVVVTAGGTHTGGTVIDVLLNKTATNANFASSVGLAPGDERGVGAGTYYIRLIATGATVGTFKSRWEERV